jgi:hypothetical protein
VTESVRVRVDSRVVEVASPLYWSATTIGGGEDGVLLTSGCPDRFPGPRLRSRCELPARLPRSWEGRRAVAVTARPGRVRTAGPRCHARVERRRGDPITIAELDQPKLTKLGRSDLWIDGTGEPVGRFRRQPELPDEHRSPGQWRIRPCGPILSVR